MSKTAVTQGEVLEVENMLLAEVVVSIRQLSTNTNLHFDNKSYKDLLAVFNAQLTVCKNLHEIASTMQTSENKPMLEVLQEQNSELLSIAKREISARKKAVIKGTFES